MPRDARYFSTAATIAERSTRQIRLPGPCNRADPKALRRAHRVGQALDIDQCCGPTLSLLVLLPAIAPQPKVIAGKTW